jgi:hypothetical protein
MLDETNPICEKHISPEPYKEVIPEHPYKWTICQDEPICQLRRICCKTHRKNTAPVVGDYDDFLRCLIMSRPVKAVAFSHRDNILCQFFENLCSGIFLKLVGASIAWEVNRNY